MRRMLLLVLVTAAAAGEDHVRSAIVKVYTTSQQPNYGLPWQMEAQEDCTGSGCVIEGNRILTNAHVVSDQTFVQVQRADLPDKRVADVLAVCHELDLALLTVKDASFFEGVTPLRLAGLPFAGDAVTTFGFPAGGTRIAVTEGVISRIDRDTYSHSDFANLVCQMDAAINPGSSGGPVVGEEGIVGVAFQAAYGQNIGYMVPAPVIEHFLRDIEDGRTDGTPVLPIRWQVLENPELRRRYRMADDQSGVLVTSVAQLFEGDDKLRARDVLLGVDDFDVANDGTIEFRAGERIGFLYAIDRKQVGDTVTLHLLRDGKPRDVTMPLAASKASYGYLVPRRQYEKRASYYVLGGLVFSPLTTNYYDTWGQWDDVPVNLQRYYDEMPTAANAQRDEIVVLTDVLPDELNVGYTGFKDAVVKTLNGAPVRSLRELVTAIEKGEEPDVRIVLEDSEAEIVLRKESLKARGPQILERYRVPADRSADLGPGK